MEYASKDIRNILVAGHAGCGKTTLTESLLYLSGATERMGRVEDGTTASDFDPEEARRKASLNSSVIPVESNGTKFNLIDVPGLFDFETGAAEGITDGDTGILIPENGDGLAAALLREGADRAYFARIGETASEKIYLSWEDSVKNARAQYRSVIERWNSGDLPRRRVLPGAPEWTGDVAELINRARTGWDKAREALDRYL